MGRKSRDEKKIGMYGSLASQEVWVGGLFQAEEQKPASLRSLPPVPRFLLPHVSPPLAPYHLTLQCSNACMGEWLPVWPALGVGFRGQARPGVNGSSLLADLCAYRVRELHSLSGDRGPASGAESLGHFRYDYGHTHGPSYLHWQAVAAAFFGGEGGGDPSLRIDVLARRQREGMEKDSLVGATDSLR